ncbi:MAG: alpha-glucosidase C-terminal domain-containing protein, partial [Chloroflexi bacterium]|nr:alpha-glucosidase C-terminal domain-containing protein [Chloroflexota bacterium]
VMDILLFYASRGAEFIRLDAIAYLWKEIGTSCINLPQTHAVVQLIRAILNEIAPHVMLITETNVPHADNISYFGDGTNEAQMVYNFSLPPLVLHAFQTGSAETLSRWAKTLTLPSEKVTFFNFLASHDGVGLNPLRGILPEVQIEAMAQLVKERHGLVSYKYNADGTQSLYELNINYFDALDNLDGWETLDLKVDRFITAHAILLSFMGVPAIYFHSLFGSRGWPEGAAQTGHNRAINRQKLQRREIERELGEENSMRAKVFQHLSSLLKIRAAHSAFAPHGEQHVLDCGDGVFALLRCDANEQDILCLHNVTAQAQQTEVNLSETNLVSSLTLRDLISNKIFETKHSLSISMQPYQTVWLLGEN